MQILSFGSKSFLVLSLVALSATARAEASAKADLGGRAPVETRIADLHSKLKITADQETLWTAVAQEMRESGGTIAAATTERESKAKTMTAIDDLNSYADIATKHSESMKKFIAVFSPLYEAMTPEQKKNADEIFRAHNASKPRSKGAKAAKTGDKQ